MQPNQRQPVLAPHRQTCNQRHLARLSYRFRTKTATIQIALKSTIMTKKCHYSYAKDQWNFSISNQEYVKLHQYVTSPHDSKKLTTDTTSALDPHIMNSFEMNLSSSPFRGR